MNAHGLFHFIFLLCITSSHLPQFFAADVLP